MALVTESANGGAGMGQPEQVRLGLYYPFIQFRNESWLKLAALYWDRIGRIVPPGYELQDSESVKRLQGELGLVTNLAPSEAAMDGVGSEFLDLLAARGPELSDLYGTRGRTLADPGPAMQSWPPPWSNMPPQRALAGPQWQVPLDPSLLPDTDPQLAYIYANGKMTPQLENALIDAELGIPVCAHGLIGMHPQLAFVYMHALASKMASSAMCPLTDDDFDHVAVGCAAGRIAGALLDFPAGQPAAASGGEDSALQFAMLALQSVIPKDISSLPVQKIIEIRRRHADELAAFQQASQAIIGQSRRPSKLIQN